MVYLVNPENNNARRRVNVKSGKYQKEDLVKGWDTETVKISKPNSQCRSKTRIHRPHRGVEVSTSAISKFIRKAKE